MVEGVALPEKVEANFQGLDVVGDRELLRDDLEDPELPFPPRKWLKADGAALGGFKKRGVSLEPLENDGGAPESPELKRKAAAGSWVTPTSTLDVDAF